MALKLAGWFMKQDERNLHFARQCFASKVKLKYGKKAGKSS
jgi:hypothetical protein